MIAYCRNGHELTPENVITRSDNNGVRCRKCKNEHKRNSLKTCARGHEYTLENTIYIIKDRHRKCRTCYILCPKGHEYSVSNTSTTGIGRRRCNECDRGYCASGYAKLKDNLSLDDFKLRNIRHNLKFFFKMTLDQYESMLVKQLWKCANPACETMYSPGKRLQVDHDHACCNNLKRDTCGLCVRGLLCNRCNLLLGQIDDSEDLLLGLVEYLRIWKSTPNYMLEETPTTKELKEDLVGAG